MKKQVLLTLIRVPCNYLWMKSREYIDLTKGPIASRMVKLAVPIVLANLLQSSYNLIDMIFASRLGGTQIAAVSFVFPLLLLISSICGGISQGSGAIIGAQLGSNNLKEAKSYVEHLKIITLAMAAIVTVPGIIFAGPILFFLGTRDNLLIQSTLYLSIIFLTFPASLISGFYMTLYRAQGRVNITTILAIIAVTGNIIFNYIFIYLLGMGIQGLAYATLITQFIGLFYIIFDYHRHNYSLSFSKNPFKVDWCRQKFIRIMKVGLPISVSGSTNPIGYLIINYMIAPLGGGVIAAFRIGNSLHSYFTLPANGIGVALTSFAAQNWGAGFNHRIRQAAKRGIIIATAYISAGIVALQLAIPAISRFFAKGDVSMMTNTANYMFYCSWAMIAFAFSQACCGLFNGIQKTKYTMIINIVRLWATRIPILIILTLFVSEIRAYALWHAMFYSNVGALAVTVVLLPKVYKKQLAESAPIAAEGI